MTAFVIVMVVLCLIRMKNSMGRIGVNVKEIYYINQRSEAINAGLNAVLAAIGIALVLADYLK